MMAWQMMLFGTVVDKGRFFMGLTSADDNAAHYAVGFVMCVTNTFLSTKQGMGEGGGLGNFKKLAD